MPRSLSGWPHRGAARPEGRSGQRYRGEMRPKGVPAPP
ncbi:Hypothetical protein A7982_01958 [Minicystis rosea]|nr:Hypothetical protein A7982_01958 [Minicystis rosea]